MEPPAAPASQIDDGLPVVEPVIPVKARGIIWLGLLILAGMQAWASRFTTTPDGMSYVDLSDAVVGGHLGQLVNAYWSPLYPVLLGLLRLVLRPGPYWEYPVQHLLNLLLFAGSILGFEYFLNALGAVAATWGRTELLTTTGRVVAYLIFGVLSLMMTPLTLPTPDLLVTTTVFVAFGALLRLRHETEWRRPATILGLALAVGSLAKSFFIPWSVICLVCALIATRERWGWRIAMRSAGIWVAVVVPWCIVLSLSVGRLTFGDTGRLTYIWYVNEIESPSAQVMPHATATPATDSILPGVAITPTGSGTNPIWYDPARWYGDLHPTWSAGQQLRVFSYLVSQYVSSLAPVILMLWFAFAVARRDDRRNWLGRTWIVLAPSLAAIGAYSLVLITTRYVVSFYIATTLVMGVGLRWPSRLVPSRVAVAAGVPFLIMAMTPTSGGVISYESAAVASVLIAWVARRWGGRGMVTAGGLGAIALDVILQTTVRPRVIVGAALIVFLLWYSSRLAIRNHEARRFSIVVGRGLVIASGLLIALVAFLKYWSSVRPPAFARIDQHISWRIAESLHGAGLPAGSRIAIVGSPFDAYWARTAGLHIVGVVPLPATARYESLPLEKRDRLFREFSRAGASVVIELRPTRPESDTSSWVPVQYLGWMKRLTTR
jgi:hypothetical protein